jgi:uncharacterized protein (DUF433 family)
MPATMDIIVNGVREKNENVYPGVVQVDVFGTLPEYRGGATMTIRFSLHASDTQRAGQVTVDPNVRGGLPCIGLNHEPIAFILDGLASGLTPQQVADHAALSLADVQLALKVAAWIMRDPALDWGALNLSEMVDFWEEMRSWQANSDELLSKFEASLGE